MPGIPSSPRRLHPSPLPGVSPRPPGAHVGQGRGGHHEGGAGAHQGPGREESVQCTKVWWKNAVVQDGQCYDNVK